MGIHTLSDLLPRLIKKIGVTPENYALLSLVELELESVSPGAKIVAFNERGIYVEVDSSVQLCEFNLMKGEIKKRVCMSIGQEEPYAFPEIKFYLKGTVRPSARFKMRSYKRDSFDRN